MSTEEEDNSEIASGVNVVGIEQDDFLELSSSEFEPLLFEILLEPDEHVNQAFPGDSMGFGRSTSRKRCRGEAAARHRRADTYRRGYVLRCGAALNALLSLG